MNDVFFWSDTHFGHTRMAEEFRPGPWANAEEMTDILIEKWRATVKPGDRIYFLGDLAFGSVKQISEWIARLTGEIHFVAGNHDHKNRAEAFKNRFVTWSDYKEIKISGQKIVLCHYPFSEWNGAHKGSWHLHGHQHGNAGPTTLPRQDVGVECFPDGPVSYEEIATLMAKREWKSVSHH